MWPYQEARKGCGLIKRLGRGVALSQRVGKGCDLIHKGNPESRRLDEGVWSY